MRASALLCAWLLIADRAHALDAMTPAQALAARGPFALSLAAGQHAGQWALETGWPLGGAPASATPGGASAARGPFDARFLATAGEDAAGRSATSYALVLDHATGPSGRWLGLSLGGESQSDGPRPRFRLAAGLAHAFTGAQVELAVVSSAMRYHGDPRWTQTTHSTYLAQPGNVPRDTSTTESVDHLAEWTTTQLAVRWQHGSMAFETVAGLSLGEGVPARQWAQETARLQLSRHVLALLSVGERPDASLAFDGAAHPHTMIGLQFAPWSTREWAMVHALRPEAVAWRAAQAGEGRTLVRVHCRETRRVEIAGDFTDWQPVELLPVHGGWWAGVLPVAAGLHHVQVRLDGGAWLVPPGLPHADEGPAGASGTMLVH